MKFITGNVSLVTFPISLAMRCARNDVEIRHRLVGLLMATGQEKEALRVRLAALIFGKNDPRKVYNQIVKIAEVYGFYGRIRACLNRC